MVLVIHKGNPVLLWVIRGKYSSAVQVAKRALAATYIPSDLRR